MKFAVATGILIALLPLSALAAELELAFHHGDPSTDREATWSGRIKFASWIDDEHVVYASHGNVICISTRTGKVQWSIKNVGEISEWSVSRGAKRLAILAYDETTLIDNKRTTSVIDCKTGELIFSADRVRMAKILGLDHVIPSLIALAPDDGRLIVVAFSTFYGRNAYLLNASYTKLMSSFNVDASPREVSVSSNGQRVAIIADEEVLCVRDLRENRDIFFRGTRITKEPAGFSFTVDVPFFSHLRDSGRDLLVYSLDDSWRTGEVFVHNLQTKKTISFDACNGHIELDVSFPTRRLALTGTSTDLTVLDLDGNVIANKSHAATERILCVEFSPSADRVLVGSWDNTLSVFSIVENGK